MNQNYSYDQVYDATVRGFDAMYQISRQSVKARWPYLSNKARCKVARGLVHLRHVGKNPEKYLSRAETADAWNARAKQFADDHALRNTLAVYLIVPTPVGMAEGPITNIWYLANGHGALGGSLWSDWYTFANQFMNYDYNITSGNASDREWAAQRNAEKIMNMSERLSDRAAEITAPHVKRAMLQFVHNFKSYQR